MPVFITKIAELTYKFQTGTITPEEQQELDQLLKGSEVLHDWFEKANDSAYTLEQLRIVEQIDVAKGWIRFQTARKAGKVKRIHRLLMFAASFIIVSLGCYYFFISGSGARGMSIYVNFLPSNAAHAANGLLRFADSNAIVLDQVPDTVLAGYEGAVIAKSADTIICTAAGTPGGTPQMVQLQSRSGKIYALQLPDGSRVWLNAQSAITFPTWFNAKDRTVQFEGEGYFEIFENADRPFLIHVGEKTVQVLGTKLSITAYADNSSFQTTLLEGKLNVLVNDTVYKVKPGQRVVVKKSGQVLQEKAPDQNQVLAWKMGDFDFADNPLTEILPEVARWYNLGLKYHVIPDNTKYSGALPRNTPPQKVLERLQSQAPYHLILQNDTIHVRP